MPRHTTAWFIYIYIYICCVIGVVQPLPITGDQLCHNNREQQNDPSLSLRNCLFDETRNWLVPRRQRDAFCKLPFRQQLCRRYIRRYYILIEFSCISMFCLQHIYGFYNLLTCSYRWYNIILSSCTSTLIIAKLS